MITHTITKIYNNISCNIVYLQLDIEHCLYIAAALSMTCCNVLRGCFDTSSLLQINTLLPSCLQLCFVQNIGQDDRWPPQIEGMPRVGTFLATISHGHVVCWVTFIQIFHQDCKHIMYVYQH